MMNCPVCPVFWNAIGAADTEPAKNFDGSMVALGMACIPLISAEGVPPSIMVKFDAAQ